MSPSPFEALAILVILDRGRTVARRAAFIASMLIPAICIEALHWPAMRSTSTSTVAIREFLDFGDYLLNEFHWRLSQTPDLGVLMSVLLMAGSIS